MQTLHGGKHDSLATAVGSVQHGSSRHPLVPQPERINPETNQKGYNVKSDIWSLGITMVTAGQPGRRRATA